jgi:hypothetical protein
MLRPDLPTPLIATPCNTASNPLENEAWRFSMSAFQPLNFDASLNLGVEF